MPLCTICGREVSFIPQYQQWYCGTCQTYPYLQQAAPPPMPAYPQPYYYPYHYPQPAYYQQPHVPPQAYAPPTVGPNPVAARAMIHGSFMARQSTDRFISTSWAWIILFFQIILPLSAFIGVLLLAWNTSFNLSDMGFLAALLLGALLISIGLAVSHAVLVHMLVKRRDEHIRRDGQLNDGMTEYLGAVAMSANVDLNVERWTMNSIRLSAPAQDRSPMLWALLVALIAVIPVVGIIFLIYCQVFLTRDVQEHDRRQRALIEQYQYGLLKAGKAKQPGTVWQPLPVRDTAAYVVLTLLTLGMFLPYWWYVNIVDMNTHMKNQWEFENALVESLRQDG